MNPDEYAPILMPVSSAPGKRKRAGITKNKGKGESKVRRRMAKESRRKNRQCR